MTTAFQQLLNKDTSKPIVLDGGMGTTLRELGGDTTGAVWGSRLLAQDPSIVSAAHKAFLEAGSDIILTNSYQTSTDGFKSIGYTEEEGVRFMRRSVELAVQARDEYIQTDAFKQSGRDIPVVGLSLGSYGAMLCGGEEYSGAFPETSNNLPFLTSFHLSRLRIFLPYLLPNSDSSSHPIDCIAFETLPLAVEITAVRKAMRQLKEEDDVDLPFWIGMSCPSGTWGDAGGLGEVGRKALWEGEEGELPFGVALNCTDTTSMAALIPLLTPSQPLPNGQSPTLILYPNHNVKYLDSSDYWDNFPPSERLTSSQWAHQLLDVASTAEPAKWSSRAIVGGCCGTASAEVQALRQAVDESKP